MTNYQYQYYLLQHPHSATLLRFVENEWGWWERWSFSNCDWVIQNQITKTELTEISAQAAQDYVREGYLTRAAIYAKHAVSVD